VTRVSYFVTNLTEHWSIDELLPCLSLQSGPVEYQPSLYFMEKGLRVPVG